MESRNEHDLGRVYTVEEEAEPRNEPAHGRVGARNGPAVTLAQRAAKRREQLLKEQTVVLEVPGPYRGMLAVEFRAISISEVRNVLERSERVSDESLRDLYQRADQLLIASINAFEIQSDHTMRELGFGWGPKLAHEVGIKTDDLTPRQCVLACFEGPRAEYALIAHTDDYSEWLREATTDVDERQKQDFPVTS